jgi:hypothetical protein
LADWWNIALQCCNGLAVGQPSDAQCLLLHQLATVLTECATGTPTAGWKRTVLPYKVWAKIWRAHVWKETLRIEELVTGNLSLPVKVFFYISNQVHYFRWTCIYRWNVPLLQQRYNVRQN